MSDPRQEFLKAIEADPYDLQARKVFADWLDEYGDDQDADLAAVQRAWTKEKQDAIVWLTAYAEDLGCDWDEDLQQGMTYDELIEAATDHVKDGQGYCLPFDTPDRVYEDNDEFWRNFELAIGEAVAEERKVPFFRCAC